MHQACQTSRFQRSELRVPLEAGATVMHGEKALAARMLDISRGGAALSANAPPPKDAGVTLSLDGLAVEARVAWADGPRFGLRFEARLRATEVFLILHRRRAVAGA